MPDGNAVFFLHLLHLLKMEHEKGEVAYVRFVEAKLQKVDGQMWLVAKQSHQKDQRGEVVHLVERKGSAEGRMCCLAGAYAWQDVVEGQVARAGTNQGQRLCVSHFDAYGGAPNLL